MVFLPSISKQKHIDLIELSQLEGKPALSIIEALLLGKPVKICPIIDPRREASNKISLQLKRLGRLADVIFEESGSRDLHVAWMFAQGLFNNLTPVRSPFLLFPVQLTAEGGHWVLQSRDGAGVYINKSLVYAYAHHQQSDLATNLFEEDFDEPERDLLSFRNFLYELIQRSTLNINFNQANFSDHLQSFQDWKRKEFEKEHKAGEIKLMPEAVLGIFPQSDSYLEPDYKELISQSGDGDVSNFFESLSGNQGDGNEIHLGSAVGESRLNLVFPVDQYQEQVVRAVKQQQSVVVEGPPGSGKSQLICNLISDAIANKKNVLVVSQKRAALEVVWKRMQDSGLENFVGMVSDFRNDRAVLYDRIAQQITKLEDYRQKSTSADLIRAERAFLSACHRIDQIVETLDHYRHALTDESQCGVSIKELYLGSDRNGESISLRQELQWLRMDEVSDFRNKLVAVATHLQILRSDGDLWSDRLDFSHLGISDLAKMRQMIGGFASTIDKRAANLLQASGLSADYFQLKLFANQAENIQSLINGIDAESYSFLQRMFEVRTEEPNELWWSNLRRLINGCFQNPGIATHIPSGQLGVVQQALHHAMKARSGIFSWVRWELFSKEKFLVKRALVAHGLSGKEGMVTLEGMLDHRLNLEHLISKLHEQEWTSRIPSEFTAEAFDQWFDLTRKAMSIRSRILEIRGLETFLSPATLDFNQFQAVLKAVAEQSIKFQRDRKNWLVYFTENQLDQFHNDPTRGAEADFYLERHFDRMCALDKIVADLPDHFRSILDRLLSSTTQLNELSLQRLFDNSLYLAWIEHLESRTPELRIVTSGVVEQLETELRTVLKTKSDLSKEIALLRATERMLDNLEFNRLNNLVSYRDLLHQVSKRKKIWPLRKTIGEFQSEIFKVMPCWLASPESVSAMFPLGEIFDLVIFDEASQCFTERAIPALSRGKLAVIAGDSMQLRPSDLYRIRLGDDEIDELKENKAIKNDLVAESLLELSRRWFRTIYLSGHYRSRLPELIGFSNRNFYGNRLVMVPDRLLLKSGESAFELIKVDGEWKDNINLTEARAVAKMVCETMVGSAQKEIGVVTFNYQQQEAIVDCIEAELAQRAMSWPVGLMVKNIENIQGDERDIIFFSIGYAPTGKGKVSMQFGSLNLDGGENRLNVAITRAREKIVVVSSLESGQLDTGSTRNKGPKLFAEWLKYVEDCVAGKRVLKKPDVKKRNVGWYLSDAILAAENIPAAIGSSGLPFANLLVTNAGGEEHLIITDDEHFVKSLTPKHHHAWLGQLLESKNWSHRKAYSRNFWYDKQLFLEDVCKLPSSPLTD